MFINVKDNLLIYTKEGKFDQKELEELLDAAYKAGYDKGYDRGYAAGKAYYPYPYWEYRPYYITTDKTIDITPHITCTNADKEYSTVSSTSAIFNPPSTTTTTATSST